MEANILKVSKNNVSFLVEDSPELHQAVNYNFWSERYLTWEYSTFQVLDRFLSKDMDYLDIGAWVGPTAIYSSFLARKVIAIEPDPIAHGILAKNIALNNINNITVINKAASHLEKASIEQCSFYGDSMTRTVPQSTSGISVETIGLNKLFEMGEFSLIKIDIEGYEFDLIPAFAKEINEKKIPILLSLHSGFVEDSEIKLKVLIDSLYDVRNVFDESGNQIKPNEVVGGFQSYLFTW